MKQCPQCFRREPAVRFVGKFGGPTVVCSGCLEVLRKGGTGAKATRREELNKHVELRVHFKRLSGNKKLGPIPMSITSAGTCPDSCSFKDAGCFAEFGALRYHWQRVPERGIFWSEFCEAVRALPEGQLWRHNVAGDLPGVGNLLDTDELDLLVLSNRGRRGFTFTHKPLTVTARLAVESANRDGFTINLSADSLEEADRKAELRCGPVTVVLPSDAPTRGLRTPAGRHVVVCPAETRGLTCADCQLCAHATRKSVVGFRAHGQWKKKVDQLVQLRKAA